MKHIEHVPGPLYLGSTASAIYRELEEPTYRFNAFIEALPRKLTTDECLKRLTMLPFYSSSERRESECYRLEAVNRLTKFRVPLTDDLITYQKFTRMLSEGYFNRNPLASEWIKQLNSGFPELLKKTEEDDYDWIPQFCNSGLGYGVFGASGVGKSSMVENILNFSPQVLIHTCYKGKPFDYQQLVWLKIDCPSHVSARSLCLDFFYIIDKLFGTNFYDSAKGMSAENMMALMAQRSAAFGLGVLVVDEVQRLYKSYSGGEQALLNFFVRLANTVKIPVVLVGTFKSLKLFSKDFSLARRIAGQGDHLISHKQNDREWEYFVRHMWRYQFTKIESPLTEGLANALYDESQGLIDVAVKLYKMAQWSVIGTGRETITPELIVNVAATNFNAARPMLQALRYNDYEKLSQIEDLIPQASDLDTFLKNSISRVVLSGSAATMGNIQKTADKPGVTDFDVNPVEEIVKRLQAVGIDSDLAYVCAQTAILRFEKSTDIKLVAQEALRLAMSGLDPDKVVVNDKILPFKKNGKKTLPLHESDLRILAKSSDSLETSTEENLRSKGVIKSPAEFY